MHADAAEHRPAALVVGRRHVRLGPPLQHLHVLDLLLPSAAGALNLLLLLLLPLFGERSGERSAARAARRRRRRRRRCCCCYGLWRGLRRMETQVVTPASATSARSFSSAHSAVRHCVGSTPGYRPTISRPGMIQFAYGENAYASAEKAGSGPPAERRRGGRDASGGVDEEEEEEEERKRRK